MNVDELVTLLHDSNASLSRTSKFIHRRDVRTYGEIEVALVDFERVALRDFAGLANEMMTQSLESDRLGVYFHEPDDPLGFFVVSVTEDGLIQLEFTVDNPIPYPLQDVHALLELTFMSLSASVVEAKIVAEYDSSFWVIRLQMNDSEVTVGQMYSRIVEAQSNLGITENRRNYDRLARVVHQLRSGLYNELIGHAETAWLDFKSFVDLDSEAGKIELAQDIARFANSERPGLLVVGYRTSRKGSEDVAAKLSPVDTATNVPTRYENIIDTRVYPSVRGLRVEQVAVDSTHCIVLIHVPARREADKPFLVHGTVAEGKVERTFFSIVRRRGDGSMPITAREIHAYLSVGRQLRS